MMEKILNLKLLKKNVNNFISILFTLFLVFTAIDLSAQDNPWTHIRSIKTPGIKKISVDRYDFMYIADDRGNVHQLDTIGNILLTFSPSRNSDIALLEAWRKVNVFVFYKNFQEYVLLDRFLTSSPNYRLNRDNIGFAGMATYSADNNLWLIDEKDFSLKKINLRFNQVDIHTHLDLILNPQTYEMVFMREYQNMLFIGDRYSGILVFDNIGNYKTKIPYQNVNYFSFINNSIYCIANDQLKIFDIYTKKEKTLQVPDNRKFEYVLLIKNKAYFFTKNTIEVYQYEGTF